MRVRVGEVVKWMRARVGEVVEWMRVRVGERGVEGLGSRCTSTQALAKHEVFTCSFQSLLSVRR